MKKLKLLLAFCALLLGWSNASAYTVSDLTSAGWTKVTSLADVNSYYYVFVDAGAQVTAMFRNNESDARPFYNTLADPLNNLEEVWVIAQNGDNYTIKGNTESFFFNSGAAGWNDYVGHNNDNGNFTFTLNSGKYDIKSVKVGDNGYVGPWNNDNEVKLDDPRIACNKSSAHAPGFFLYSISRTTFEGQLAEARATAAAGASEADPVDVTSYIVNPSFTSKNAQGWTRTGSAGNQQWGQSTMESWNATNVVVKQEIRGVPNGLYKLTADVISGNNENKVAYVYAIGDTKVSSSAVSAVASAGNYNTMSSEVAGKTLTADNVSVTGNSLTVGIDQSAGWIVADNFKLYYYGPTVACNAIALPDGGAMAADTWYYFDIAVAGDNYNATATTLGDIVYTTDGSILIEDESGISDKFTAENNSLSVTRYYVKSSSAQSLVIAPASYSYSISEASADVSYIQAGNTVTVSFTASTNDPGATLTQNYSGVTFDGKQKIGRAHV